jgi:vancomycin resistance protein YoaR
MAEGEDAGRIALRSGVALTVLGAAYLALALFLGQHVPAGVTVDGVPIGGMSPGQASATLRQALAAKAAAPVHLQAGDRVAEVDPGAAGLALDVKGTLNGLTGFSLQPAELWQHLTGARAAPLRITVDRAGLKAALTGVAGTVDRPVKEGSISFDGGRATAELPEQGQSLKVDETADAVRAGWPGQPTIRAVLAIAEPRVKPAAITRAMQALAVPAVSGPVKVRAGDRTIVLRPEQFAAALAVEPDPSGALRLRVDGAVLARLLQAVDPQAEREPVDAKVVVNAGRPTVVPGVPGQKYDPATVPSAFLPALTSPSRTAVVRTATTPPKVTTEAVKALGVKELVSTFTTHFPHNPPRTSNITVAARTLNGTIVKDGETFSLNGLLGQRTPAKGYQRAPVINEGRLETDYGGGISQVSTTLFNAAFFAGVAIIEHTPHSFYISRYPEGREATVSWPGVDNTWRNDSGHAILIQTAVTGSDITVSFFGTKVWDVEAAKGPRRNVTQPRKITDNRPGCVPQTPTPGFDVTVTRIFKRAGAQVRTSQFTTHYIPEDDVTCTHQAG